MSKKKRRRRQRPANRTGPPSPPHQQQPMTSPPRSRAPAEIGREAGPPAPPGHAERGHAEPGHAEPGHGEHDAEPGQSGHGQVLIGLIVSGALDGYLGVVQGAIAQRRRELTGAAGRQAAARLQIGDRVVLTDDIRPLYLHGATGTLVGWAKQNAIIELDNPTGRFATGQVRCPPLGVRLVPD